MRCHSALKKNEILSFAAKWMELQNIMLTEISQDTEVKHKIRATEAQEPRVKS
jgi:hypothetical protein